MTESSTYLDCLRASSLVPKNVKTTHYTQEQLGTRFGVYILDMMRENRKTELFGMVDSYTKSSNTTSDITSDQVFMINPGHPDMEKNRCQPSKWHNPADNQSLAHTPSVLALQYYYPCHDFLLDPTQSVPVMDIRRDHDFWKHTKFHSKEPIKNSGITPYFGYTLQWTIRFALEKKLLSRTLYQGQVSLNPFMRHEFEPVTFNREDMDFPPLVSGLYIGYGIVTNKFIMAPPAAPEYKVDEAYVREYLQDRLMYWTRKTDTNSVLPYDDKDSDKDSSQDFDDFDDPESDNSDSSLSDE